MKHSALVRKESPFTFRVILILPMVDSIPDTPEVVYDFPTLSDVRMIESKITTQNVLDYPRRLGPHC